MDICLFQNISQNDINDLFEESDSHWFHHTEHWRTCILNMRTAGSKDLSFGVYQGNKLVAFSPLIKELILNSKDKFEFSMGGSPSSYPIFFRGLSKANKIKIEKFVFNYIFNLAIKEDISYMNFYVSPLSCLCLDKNINVNPLPKFGFHDTTVTTNILSLGLENETLFRNFRKGTKSDIKTAIKNNINVNIYDSSNITKTIFNLYKKIHFEASGRQTRPDKTWDLFFQWVKKGLSLLSIVTKEQKYVAAVFITTYNNKAYYQSGATLPSYDHERGVGHLAQWEIIKFLNNNNFTHYDLGINLYRNISQEVADEKLLGISRFKSGFGADIFPYFRGEWFRDKDFMLAVYKERIDELYSSANH